MLQGSARVSLPSSTPVTARLVPRATEGALRLLLGEGGADASMSGNRAGPCHLGRSPRGAVMSQPSEGNTAAERIESPGEDRELSWRLWYEGKVFIPRQLCFLAVNGARGNVMDYDYFFSCFVLRQRMDSSPESPTSSHEDPSCYSGGRERFIPSLEF